MIAQNLYAAGIHLLFLGAVKSLSEKKRKAAHECQNDSKQGVMPYHLHT